MSSEKERCGLRIGEAWRDLKPYLGRLCPYTGHPSANLKAERQYILLANGRFQSYRRSLGGESGHHR